MAPEHPISFSLSFSGGVADEKEIDFYDVGQALIGFQRSLALTTHLILNGKIITQAPSLQGAQIHALPPEEGSWRFVAIIAIMWNIGTTPKDSPLGHLISSAYDYIISETLGFHVDYDKTLGLQYEELKKQDPKIEILSRPRFDSLTEKCEVAILNMHRPIVKSETAALATIESQVGSDVRSFPHPLNRATFEYIRVTEEGETPFEYEGRVSSYNVNTYKGRIYIGKENRPVQFELGEDARGPKSVARITESLAVNAQTRFKGGGDISIVAFRNTSKTGRLKSLLIVEVSK